MFARKPGRLFRCISSKTLPGKATRHCWDPRAEPRLYINILIWGDTFSHMSPHLSSTWEKGGQNLPVRDPSIRSDPPEASVPAGESAKAAGVPTFVPAPPFAPPARRGSGRRGGTGRPARGRVRTGAFVNCCLCVYLMRCGAASSGGRRAAAQPPAVELG